MKAISLKQPFASMVCSGEKTLETRTWNTSHRGDLVICSSKKPEIEPYGKALCIVEVTDTEPMQKKHEKAACTALYPGAWVWHLRNIRSIEPPVPVRGSLGLFDIELEYKP